MKAPNKLTVQIKSDFPTKVENIISVVKVRSGTKNPFYILFPKTDSQGVAKLTQDDFVGQLIDHFEEALMDYNGTIESAIQ